METVKWASFQECTEPVGGRHHPNKKRGCSFSNMHQTLRSLIHCIKEHKLQLYAMASHLQVLVWMHMCKEKTVNVKDL